MSVTEIEDEPIEDVPEYGPQNGGILDWRSFRIPSPGDIMVTEETGTIYIVDTSRTVRTRKPMKPGIKCRISVTVSTVTGPPFIVEIDRNTRIHRFSWVRDRAYQRGS